MTNDQIPMTNICKKRRTSELVIGAWSLVLWDAFRIRSGLTNELADLLELRRARPPAPFEEGGFRRRQRRPGGVHAAKRDVMIDLSAGRDRIRGDIDVESFGQKIVHGLADANMCFNAADENFP